MITYIWGRRRSNELRRMCNERERFWEHKCILTGAPKKSLCQKNMQFAVTPLVLTPFVPFRSAAEGERQTRDGPSVDGNMPAQERRNTATAARTLQCN